MKTSWHISITLAIALLQGTALIAYGEDAGVPLRHFQHTAWTLQDGAPSEINVIAQTQDGYLWLGTANGLFRFDGIKFERYRLPHGQTFLEDAITSLLATEDGGLWIGYTYGGTSFLKDGVIQNQEIHLAHGRGTIFSFIRDEDGSVLAASNTGLARFYSGTWHDMDENRELGDKGTFMLHRDHAGALWVTTEDFLYRRDPGSKHFDRTGIKPGQAGLFAEENDGSLLVMDGKGILRSTDCKLKQRARPYVASYSDEPFDLLVDRTGALWILGAKTGIRRIPRPSMSHGLTSKHGYSSVEHFTSHDGLTSDRAFTIFEDREGNVWVGTPDGLDRFRMSVFETAPLPSTFGEYALISRPDGSLLIGTEGDGLQTLSHGKVTPRTDVTMTAVDNVYQATNGDIWLGGTGQLGSIRNDRFTLVPLPASMMVLPRPTQTMTGGPEGDLWIQTASAKGIMRLHKGKWSEVPGTGKKNGAAIILSTDHLGRIWAGYMQGFILRFDESVITRIDAQKGLNVGKVTALYDSGTTMWIGGERGLNFISDSGPTPINFAGNRKVEGISGIFCQDDGSMWINALPGVLHVPADEVKHALKEPSYALHYQLFNYLDGLAGKAPQLRPLPSVTRGVNHLLWFTTTNGAASIDTADIYRNVLPPPVLITSIISDGTAIEPTSAVTLPKGTDSLEIDYAALSLSMPERVLFRYRLEGDDKAWQEPGTRREAFYSHLSPGRYVFHVIACNNDGVWNDTGASVAISLPPTFLQSWSFKAAAAIMALITLWLISRLRVKQATAKLHARLYERFAERERIARDLHDTFFQGIQGLLLSFQSTSRTLPEDDPTRLDLEKTLLQSDSVMLQGRELVLNLRQRSRNVHDLGSRLESDAMEFVRYHPAEFRMTISGEPTPLKDEVCQELAKLGREALSNAYRHSKAERIEVQIEFGSGLFKLSITDNGMGITRSTLEDGRIPNHWGLPGMRERANKLGATFEIVSDSGSGTSVIVTLKSRLAYLTERSEHRFLKLKWRFRKRSD
jgi:signal transduction histidine kinase/ligand-binding sensor domain-containing protein